MKHKWSTILTFLAVFCLLFSPLGPAPASADDQVAIMVQTGGAYGEVGDYYDYYEGSCWCDHYYWGADWGEYAYLDIVGGGINVADGVTVLNSSNSISVVTTTTDALNNSLVAVQNNGVDQLALLIQNGTHNTLTNATVANLANTINLDVTGNLSVNTSQVSCGDQAAGVVQMDGDAYIDVGWDAGYWECSCGHEDWYYYDTYRSARLCDADGAMRNVMRNVTIQNVANSLISTNTGNFSGSIYQAMYGYQAAGALQIGAHNSMSNVDVSNIANAVDITSTGNTSVGITQVNF